MSALLCAAWLYIHERRRQENNQIVPAIRGMIRRPYSARVYKTRVNIFGMERMQVIKIYRLDADSILELLALIHDDLLPNRRISTSITPLVKLLSVLHFCASGSFQGTVALTAGISQSSFSKVLHQVMESLLKHVHKFIVLPLTASELAETKRGFHAIAGIPNVVGAVDGTHIRLVPPHASEHIFRNGKMQYSINVQIICNSALLITHVNANFPGSCDDSFVMRSSSVPRIMEGMQNSWLIGDSAYPLKRWLITPFEYPASEAEVKFNMAHSKTRGCIERTFGLLKGRFRCLHSSGSDLLYKPSKVCRIVVVCAMLHNVAVKRGVPLPEDTEHDNVDDRQSEELVQPCPEDNSDAGVAVRQMIIQNLSSH